MQVSFPINKISIKFILLFLLTSCGSDMVEDTIELYESGNKKVFVRYHPEPNVLEKHFYNAAGEMVHIERDSLSYGYFFQQFMLGTWIIDKMTVDDEIMFERDSVLNLDSLPNIYTFTDKKLIIEGPQYKADYDIIYIDSSMVEFDGRWTYGNEGEDTYRTQRIYDIDFFKILSYYNIIWTDFIEDSEKEEEVIFRRIILPDQIITNDTLLTDF